MGIRGLGTGLVLAMVVSACGGASTDPEADSTNAVAEPAASEPVAEAAEEQSIGALSFSVDGAEKSFDFLPDGHNVYTKVSSTVVALPKSGATEQFMITFLSIDLKDYTYPAELPGPRDPSNPMSAMSMVGFSYTDADGSEWAGPGKIQIESFDNSGVIEGSFDGVTLPHTDKERPDVTLTGGSFNARITSPW